MKYVVVTPVRDEELNIEQTINSMIAQTVLPECWVIVNDGSRDRTGEILEKYAKRFAWIRAVHRADRGARKSGGGVVEAFQDGYPLLADMTWDFIVKLDGDLSFERDYFEKCLNRFQENDALGIGGGMIGYMINGQFETERSSDPVFHVRGATKIYRRECWDAIGGLACTTGWDTIDEMKANMLGWRTYPFRNLFLVQHRQTGASDGSWRNSVKNGRANYVTGYHPLFMLLKCAKRIFSPPFLIDAAGLFWGYFGSCLAGMPNVSDRDLIAYVRKQQMNRLRLRPSLYTQPKSYATIDHHS